MKNDRFDGVYYARENNNNYPPLIERLNNEFNTLTYVFMPPERLRYSKLRLSENVYNLTCRKNNDCRVNIFNIQFTLFSRKYFAIFSYTTVLKSINSFQFRTNFSCLNLELFLLCIILDVSISKSF